MQRQEFVSTFWTRNKAYVRTFRSWSKNYRWTRILDSTQDYCSNIFVARQDSYSHILNAYNDDSNIRLFQTFSMRSKPSCSPILNASASCRHCVHIFWNRRKDFFPSILTWSYTRVHTFSPQSNCFHSFWNRSKDFPPNLLDTKQDLCSNILESKQLFSKHVGLEVTHVFRFQPATPLPLRDGTPINMVNSPCRHPLLLRQVWSKSVRFWPGI